MYKKWCYQCLFCITTILETFPFFFFFTFSAVGLEKLPMNPSFNFSKIVFNFSSCREKLDSIKNSMHCVGSATQTIYSITVLESSLWLSYFELAIWRVEMLPPPFPKEVKLAALHALTRTQEHPEQMRWRSGRGTALGLVEAIGSSVLNTKHRLNLNSVADRYSLQHTPPAVWPESLHTCPNFLLLLEESRRWKGIIYTHVSSLHKVCM